MKDGRADHCTFLLGGQPGMLCFPTISDAGLNNLTIELHSSDHQHLVSTLSTVTEMSLNNTEISCTVGPSRDMTTIRIIKGIQLVTIIIIINGYFITMQ
jgi:hypothetical protein